MAPQNAHGHKKDEFHRLRKKMPINALYKTSVITTIILLAELASAITTLDEPMVVRHYQHQERYEFGQALLNLALSNVDKPYKIIPPIKQAANEARGEILVIDGVLDLQWMSTSEQRENTMIPIRIPIYQGILGLRLMLVKKENHDKFSSISNIAELRKFTAGHGQHWQDLPVYEANRLPVKTYVEYHALFRQLASGRFDYFHRGINEIWQEFERHNHALSIADNVMLFYPHPVYFFVSKHRPKLAEDLKRGLRKALKEGTFKQLFLNHHQSFIDKGKLNSRHLIRLKNPVVPDNTPVLDTQWWLPREFLD